MLPIRFQVFLVELLLLSLDFIKNSYHQCKNLIEKALLYYFQERGCYWGGDRGPGEAAGGEERPSVRARVRDRGVCEP